MKKFKFTPILGAALALATASGCVDTRKTVGQNISESALSTKARTALANRRDFNTGDIKITVDRGVVQLSGYVDHVEHIPRVERVVRNIDGVVDVDNQLTVRRTPLPKK